MYVLITVVLYTYCTWILRTSDRIPGAAHLNALSTSTFLGVTIGGELQMCAYIILQILGIV